MLKGVVRLSVGKEQWEVGRHLKNFAGLLWHHKADPTLKPSQMVTTLCAVFCVELLYRLAWRHNWRETARY